MMTDLEDSVYNGAGDAYSSRDEAKRAPKRVTFDDFQITRSVQQKQVEEERRAWQERQERLEQQKSSFLRMAVPRLKSLRDDMVGEKKGKLSFFRRRQEAHVEEPEETIDETPVGHEPYFAEHERSVIRVVRREEEERRARDPNAGEHLSDQEIIEAYYAQGQAQHSGRPTAVPPRYSRGEEAELQEEHVTRDQSYQSNSLEDDDYDDEYEEEVESDEADETRASSALGRSHLQPTAEDEEHEYNDEEGYEEEESYEGQEAEVESYDDEEREEMMNPSEYVEGAEDFASESAFVEDGAGSSAEQSFFSASDEEIQFAPQHAATFEPAAAAPSRSVSGGAASGSLIEPEIDASLGAFLDSLRSFDSRPRRANETRDPRADFVLLLGELLDILREQVNATSAMFFWVNTKKQQLVLESAALDDRAYQFLASDKRFSIELDAVSRVVAKKRPELHSLIPAQAELDLIPYYRESVGIASFAGMPVLFGDGLVAVLTVDSVIEENFTAETLRILTSYSKLISGLIRSYIEKYDLLASARTLESARKLHQIVSPDTSLRVLREQRKNPDYILRALSEAASEIIDWDWLGTASFDEARRIWCLTSLQSKHGGAYVPPQTPISLAESIVGKCLQTGRSSRLDQLTSQNVRFNLEEERSNAAGHSFMVIPIRTTNKNYGALAIEHSERGRFTDADVETLEHLARSAAAALEIIALSEIVGERALTDLLTGVLNKRGLLQRLNEELARAMEFDEPLTLVLFEIDGAAEFFSRFSQEDSDTIVLAITRLLRFGSRAFDVISRVGEHMFAAVLIKMTDEEAYLWSEKMRKMIVSEVIAIGKRSFSVTASIGVSGARRDGTVDELVEGAELAIERARELGGNNVIVY